MRAVTIIAIAGSSGAGKTTVSKELVERVNQDKDATYAILSSDNYYRCQGHLSEDDRETVNYDHPDTIDFPLLRKHLLTLQQGRSIEVPTYDVVTHHRTDKLTRFNAATVIFVEGILLLALQAGLIDLLDVKLFVESTRDLCFNRRLARDTDERGRTEESVRKQYAATVGPMDEAFVRPSRAHANLVVKNSTKIFVEGDGLRFNLDPIVRYLNPILAGEAPPSNRSLRSLFQAVPSEITLTAYGAPEAVEPAQSLCTVM